MRTPRRLVAALAAAALSWTTLSLVATPGAEAASTGHAGHGKKHHGHQHQGKGTRRDAPHDPATYYAGTEGLTGNALALKLNEIIDGNTFVPYTSSGTDVWKALKVLDRDPNDPTKIIDAYNGDSLDAANQCGSSCALNGWNREHTWAQSRGSFDTTAGPGTDLFHMRPLRGNTNSSRGNKDFDNGGTANVPGCPNCRSTSSTFEPVSSFKGDLARGLFYMDVRFNGDADDGYGVDLKLWDQVGNSGSQIGKLSTLVAWSLADPPDNGERNRNNLIDGDYQHNRNPFIDHPEWVCSIWGSQVPAATCATSNHAPVATPQSTSTPEDTAKVITLAGSDSDGDSLTFVKATDPAHGTVSITSAGQATYTPASDYNGPDSFTFTVNDGTVTSAPATVSITVTPVNDAPVATPQNVSTPQNTAKVVTLSGTDVDNAAGSLTYAIQTQPSHGSVSLSGNQATYTPASGYSGPDSFTFTANDGALTSAPATVSVNVISAVNHAPQATAQSVTTAEDTTKTITLTGNDSDGDTLTFAKASDPAHGTVEVTSAGQATYTPAANYHGPDSFTFTASDSALTSAPATVSIDVTSVNDAPTASAQSVTTAEDTAKTFTLTGNDVDGDTLTFAKASDPGHGSVTVTPAGQATYTPAANYHGPDSFTFTVNDGTVTSPAATVSVTVTAVNDAPTANGQSVTTDEDTAKVITLTGTDPDIDDELTFAKASDPAHGTVTFNGDQATYTPAANYHGPDSFTFTVSDGTVSSGAATVSITVDPVNDAPTANGQSVTTNEDTPKVITLTGNDVDGNDLVFTKVSDPAHGTVTYNGDQATYTPAANYHGPDSFTFSVNDGTVSSAPATVSITVDPVNDAPTATAAQASTDQDTAVVVTLAGTDVDGDDLTFAKASDPAHGTVSITAAGQATYTPSAGYSGPDSFTFTVNDGTVTSAPATVNIAVAPYVFQDATVTLQTPAATRGKPVTTTVVVSGASGSPTPTGQVVVKNGATTLGTVTLGADGRGTLVWTPVRAGATTLVATYAGDSVYHSASSAPTTVNVAKSASALTFKGKIKSGKPGRVKVAITSVGGNAATGSITIRVAGKKYTATLNNGVARFKLPATTKAKVTVRAKYAGDSQYAAAKGKRVYQVG